MKQLRFGTSGLRALVTEMTDMECYINARGFIDFLKECDEIDDEHNQIALGGDLRTSTPVIMASVAQAIEDSGCKVLCCGKVPTPTLAYFAIENNIPGIMVTGSHIPEDRNGIKFTKKSGEVLKTDEADILKNVAKIRELVSSLGQDESLFNKKGMFKIAKEEPASDFETKSIDMYIKRYSDVFSADLLKGKRIVLYQHSAVGRDIEKTIFEGLGAEVITIERSDKFVPVDTEKVSERTIELLRKAAEEYKPFALISTDGDSDRPLLADENGKFLPGDKLGALVSVFLDPDFAAIPISTNDAVVKTLGDKGIKVIQTKIGSPYVIAAMNDELLKNPEAKVVSWESNGGFLLGSDWDIDGKFLKALPTRDAALPLISVLLLAANENVTVSELIAAKLPSRYTHADVVDDKTKGCEAYTPEMGKAIIKMFSPEEGTIKEVHFGTDAGSNDIKEKLSRYFNKDNGFDEIVSMNCTDGIRIIFANNDVAHIRPSGNAPEFRIYATSDTQERAEEIVSKMEEIVAHIVRDMTEGPSPKSVGAEAASTKSDADTPLGIILNGVSNGKPIYLRPYKQPKIWGIDGIGEYWYGAEDGEKSSIAAMGNNVAPMQEVVKHAREQILGSGAIKKFGDVFPLVKILTPKDRLSVQFHDTKNELWIVTGIDNALAWKPPSIILGFSSGTVDKYGKDVTQYYHKTLKEYAEALNALIDLIEKHGYKDILEKTGDVIQAVRELREKELQGVHKAVERLNSIRQGLERFYNYKKVKVGDVIPVPSGTLHAIGPGITVIEPQIPGSTQSLEDGSNYPVRYYFPGYERPGAEKKLALDRVSEMIADIVKESFPEVIEKTAGHTMERLPGNFEEKGIEVHRITMQKGAGIDVQSIASFHNLVAVKGEVKIIVSGSTYTIPQSAPGGEMLIIPAAAKSYKITAETKAQLIDTFIPV